jgi:TRAP-type C4-dicarboxylate transport system substrate-binding protein
MKNFVFMKSCLTICMAVLLTAAFTLPAFADKVKFGHVAPPFHGQAKGVDAFAAYVKEKTNGKIDIATFPSGQLGGERSMAGRKMKSGILPTANAPSAPLKISRA